MIKLSASEDFRRQVALAIPEPYTKGSGGSDIVTFHVEAKTDKQGYFSKERRPNCEGSACYSSIRPSYNEYDVECFPEMKSPISLEEATEFIQLMINNHIATPLLELSWDKYKGHSGVFMRVKAGSVDPQIAYATLTCYRWINTCPALVWETLALHRLQLGISVFQILPYVIATHIGNSNHSFLTSMRGAVSTHSTSGCNPLLGVATKRYFDPRLPRPVRTNHGYGNGYICEAIRELVEKITPLGAKTPPDPNKPWSGNNSRPTFMLEQLIDGLDPDLLPLYEDGEPTRERAAATLTQIHAKKGSTCSEK